MFVSVRKLESVVQEVFEIIRNFSGSRVINVSMKEGSQKWVNQDTEDQNWIVCLHKTTQGTRGP